MHAKYRLILSTVIIGLLYVAINAIPVGLIVNGTIATGSYIDTFMVWKTATREASAPTVDVPTWNIGDWWNWVGESYTMRYGEDGQPDYLHEYDNFTDTVTEIITVTHNGKTYDVYNLTVTGTVKGDGTISSGDAGGVMDIEYEMETDASGFIWIRRADLAIVYSYTYYEGTATATNVIGSPSGKIYMKSIVSFDVPEEDYDFPIFNVGELWRVIASAYVYGWLKVEIVGYPYDDDAEGAMTTNANAQALEYAPIEVKAGTFDVYHIYLDGIEDDSIQEFWWSDDVKMYVKCYRENIDMGFTGKVINATAELVAYDINHPVATPLSIELNPAYSYPGGNVLVSGTTAPMIPVTIATPINDMVWSTTADNMGYYAYEITAPGQTACDSTPTDYDISSDGVIVSAGDAHIVTTLILVDIPELTISSDAIVVPDTPSIDIETTITATVQNIGTLAAENVKVSFYDASTLIGETTITYIAPNDSGTASITYAFTSGGIHNIEVKVDEQNLILEQSEENNAATIEIYVNTPPQVTLRSPSNGVTVDTVPTLEWTVTDPDESDVIEFYVYLDADRLKVEAYDYSVCVAYAYTGTSYTKTPLNDDTTYYWTVIPNDGICQGTCMSGIWMFTTDIGNPPIIVELPEDIVIPNDGKTAVTIEIKVSDPDGLNDIEAVTIDLTEVDGSPATTMLHIGEGIYAIELIVSPDVPEGWKILTIEVCDSAGLFVTGELRVRVTTNVPPVLIEAKSSPSTVPNDGKTTTLLTVELRDEDGLKDIAYVQIDLTPIGGTADQPMFNDGISYGDVAIDWIFSYETVVAPGTPTGEVTLTVTIRDSAGNKVTAIIVLIVTEPTPDGTGITDDTTGPTGGDSGTTIITPGDEEEANKTPSKRRPSKRSTPAFELYIVLSALSVVVMLALLYERRKH